MVLCFSIITLNCNGIKNWTKRKTILNKIRASKVDIAFLQETISSPEVGQKSGVIIPFGIPVKITLKRCGYFITVCVLLHLVVKKNARFR